MELKAGSALALFATDADFGQRARPGPVPPALVVLAGRRGAGDRACVVPPIAEQADARSLLLCGGWLGIVAVAAQGWFIGVHGWSYDALTQVFGELDDRQFGMGWGGCMAFAGFVVLTTTGLALRGRFGGDRFVAGAVGLLVASILLFTVWPVLTILGQALSAPAGQAMGAMFLERFFQPKIWGLACFYSKSSCGAAWNTLVLAITTATACMLLGLAFALIVTRTGFRFKQMLRLLTVLPIITPPFVIGLGLILIFGRSGLINQWAGSLFGVELGRWIYGFNGVWLAQVFSFTPTAFLVLIGVVQGISPTMEEASQTLRASPARTFASVTLPLMLPGLANAWLVVFIESLADFGNPILLGGSMGVLSTEIFFAVVGAQADFGRAGTLAIVLLIFALVAFFAQRTHPRQAILCVDDGQRRWRPADAAAAARQIRGVCGRHALGGAYRLRLSAGARGRLRQGLGPGLDADAFAFRPRLLGGMDAAWAVLWTGGAWGSLFTTLTLSAVAAPITALLGLLAAWVLSRQKFAGRMLLEFALMLTFCVPGTVIGVAYILTYNLPPVEITGTAIILVVCFVFRNLPVGVRSGLAAMSQLDKSLDEASATLRASTFRTLTTCGAAADQAGGRDGAGLFLCARHDDGVGRHLPDFGAVRDGDRVHHQSRDQRRLRDCDCLFDRADCDDDDRDRHHPSGRRRTKTRPPRHRRRSATLLRTPVTGARA